jgi:DNA-binding transcriptional MocR family regulator
LAWRRKGQLRHAGLVVATERLIGWLGPSLETGPLNEGLASGLRGLVLDGRLVTGTRLPAERELAAALGLARATVTTAYDRLRGEGFLISRRGAGTVVRLPLRPVARPDEPRPPAGDDVIDLTIAATPAPAVLQDAAADAAAELPRHLAGAGLHPMGLPELRQAVAERYTARGLPTRSDEILISSGALHAWNLLLRVLACPGAAVVAEQPTYPAVLDAAMAHHATVVPLPVDATGWDLSQLARPARSPVLAHLTLDGQNPTGLWADDPTRRQLLDVLDPRTVAVVDETLAELHYPEAPATRPAPALARRGTTVVAVGSMSKSFWAGLRLGWIRGPAALIRRLAAARAGQDLGSPLLDQLVAVRLLAVADDVLPERRRVYAARRDAMLAALVEHAPTWRAELPQGGLAVWVDLGETSSTRLAQRVAAKGVRITPGPRFTVAGTHDHWVRLPFVDDPDRIAAAVKRLAAAAEGAGTSRMPRRRGGPETAWTA